MDMGEPMNEDVNIADIQGSSSSEDDKEDIFFRDMYNLFYNYNLDKQQLNNFFLYVNNKLRCNASENNVPNNLNNPNSICFNKIIDKLINFKNDNAIGDNTNDNDTNDNISAKLNIIINYFSQLLDNNMCNGISGFTDIGKNKNKDTTNRTTEYNDSKKYETITSFLQKLNVVNLKKNVLNNVKSDLIKTGYVTEQEKVNLNDKETLIIVINRILTDLNEKKITDELAKKCDSNKSNIIEQICGEDNRLSNTKYEVKWENSDKLCNTLEPVNHIDNESFEKYQAYKKENPGINKDNIYENIFLSFCKYYKSTLDKRDNTDEQFLNLLKNIFKLLTESLIISNSNNLEKLEINKSNFCIIYLSSYFLIKDTNIFNYAGINTNTINIFIEGLSQDYQAIEKFDEYIKFYDLAKGFYNLSIVQDDPTKIIESTITLNPLSMSIIPLAEITHDFAIPKDFAKPKIKIFNAEFTFNDEMFVPIVPVVPIAPIAPIAPVVPLNNVLPSFCENIKKIIVDPSLVEIINDNKTFNEQTATKMMLKICEKYNIPFVNESKQKINVLFDMTNHENEEDDNKSYGGTISPSYLFDSLMLDENDANALDIVVYSQNLYYYPRINKLITGFDAGRSRTHKHLNEQWERELQLTQMENENNNLYYQIPNDYKYKFNLNYNNDSDPARNINILSIESDGKTDKNKNKYKLTLYFIDLDSNPISNIDGQELIIDTFIDANQNPLKETPLQNFTSKYIENLLINKNGVLKKIFEKNGKEFNYDNVKNIRTSLSMVKMCGDMQYSISSIVSAANNLGKNYVFNNGSYDYSAIFNVLNIYPETFTYMKDDQELKSDINKENVITNLSSIPGRGMFFAAKSKSEQSIFYLLSNFLENDENRQLNNIKMCLNKFNDNTGLDKVTHNEINVSQLKNFFSGTAINDLTPYIQNCFSSVTPYNGQTNSDPKYNSLQIEPIDYWIAKILHSQNNDISVISEPANDDIEMGNNAAVNDNAAPVVNDNAANDIEMGNNDNTNPVINAANPGVAVPVLANNGIDANPGVADVVNVSKKRRISTDPLAILGGSQKHKRNKNKTRKQKRNSKNKTIKRKKSLKHKKSRKHN